MDLQKVEEIVAKYQGQPSALIEILLDVQEEDRYLHGDVLLKIADTLKIPPSRTYHLATFFKAFSLKPRGRHSISVCLGTACHVGGGVKIIEKLERDLSISRGGTTEDLQFSLDEVHCLGCCGLAPVVTVDDDVYGKLTLSKVSGMLKKYTKKTGEAEDAQDQD
jgi:NADH:ubiquinone oxidoreductase subunit E